MLLISKRGSVHHSHLPDAGAEKQRCIRLVYFATLNIAPVIDEEFHIALIGQFCTLEVQLITNQKAYAGSGSESQWNETFVFSVSGDASELHLKIMDKDTFTADDFLGEAR